MKHTIDAYPTGHSVALDDDGLQVWAFHEWLEGVLPLPLDACEWVPVGASSALDWVAECVPYALTIPRA